MTASGTLWEQRRVYEAGRRYAGALKGAVLTPLPSPGQSRKQVSFFQDLAWRASQ